MKPKIAIVISSKMNKTILVELEYQLKILKLKKFLNKKKIYYVHNENFFCNNGDLVLIKMCAPKSKLKNWELTKIIKQSINNYDSNTNIFKSRG